MSGNNNRFKWKKSICTYIVFWADQSVMFYEYRKVKQSWTAPAQTSVAMYIWGFHIISQIQQCKIWTKRGTDAALLARLISSSRCTKVGVVVKEVFYMVLSWYRLIYVCLKDGAPHKLPTKLFNLQHHAKIYSPCRCSGSHLANFLAMICRCCVCHRKMCLLSEINNMNLLHNCVSHLL